MNSQQELFHSPRPAIRPLYLPPPNLYGRITGGRVKPSLPLDASVGADLRKSERLKMRLQPDVENLNNRLNVIDFAGLFSGNAVAPPRSGTLRLTAEF